MKNKVSLFIIILICVLLAAFALIFHKGGHHENKNIVSVSSTASYASPSAKSKKSEPETDSVQEADSVVSQTDYTLTEDTYGKFYYTILQNIGYTRNDKKTKRLVAAISKSLKDKNIDTKKIENVQIAADEGANIIFEYEGKTYTISLSYDDTTGNYHAYLLDGDKRDQTVDSLVADTMDTAKIKDLPSDALKPFNMDESQFVKKLADECRSYGLQYQTLTWGSVVDDTDAEYSVLIWMNSGKRQNVTVSYNKSTQAVTYVFG